MQNERYTPDESVLSVEKLEVYPDNSKISWKIRLSCQVGYSFYHILSRISQLQRYNRINERLYAALSLGGHSHR